MLVISDEEKDKKDEDNNHHTSYTGSFPPVILHSSSTLCGLMAAHLFFEMSIVYLICLAILSYRLDF